MRSSYSHDLDTTLGTIDTVPPASSYFGRKSWPTRVLGSLMLIVASPLIFLLVILVRSTSAGPGLYRQARTGKNGVTFLMYKIRTMYQNAVTVSGPVWCQPGDSRITPIGKVLRLLHLDELPQLINVARGEMDLVGPRPERPVFVARLAREIPRYMERVRVLPGVTGLAQINLPPDQTLECVRKKLSLDCAYIREANMFLDLRILLCTMLRMIGIRHGHAARLLGLQRQPNPLRILREDFAPTESHWSGYVANGHVDIEDEGEFAALVASGDDAGNELGSLTLRDHNGQVVLRSLRPR
jgi:lipopolysaccharide/colanic/teichoic acid biosynthesis glycosyltransferase